MERLRVMWVDKHGDHHAQTIAVDEFEEWWMGVGIKSNTVRVRGVYEGEDGGRDEV